MTVADLLKLARPYAEQRSATDADQERILGLVMDFVGHVDEVVNETPEERKRRLARERQQRRRKGGMSRSCHADGTSTGESLSRSVTFCHAEAAKAAEAAQNQTSHVTLCHAEAPPTGESLSRICHAEGDSDEFGDIPPFSPDPSIPPYNSPHKPPKLSLTPTEAPATEKPKKKRGRTKVADGGFHLWTPDEFRQRARAANDRRKAPLPGPILQGFCEFWLAPTKQGFAKFSDCSSWSMPGRLSTWYSNAVKRGEIQAVGGSNDLPDDFFS